MIARILRAVAWGLVALAVVDPGIERTVRGPVPVDLRDGEGRLVSPSAAPAVLADQLSTDGGQPLSINQDPVPMATLLIGDPTPRLRLPATGSVSILRSPIAAPVRILRADPPSRARVGWRASTRVTLERQGSDATTIVTLEQDGMPIDRVEHQWQGDQRATAVVLSHVPLAEGAARLTVRAISGSGDGDRRELQIVASASPIRVLAVDARPSWASSFVRRALEDDPAFAVISLVRASRGIDVRAGDPPARLTETALAAFDVVLIGAPEAVAAGECAALGEFLTRRGGTVVLLPDRRPSGSCAALATADGFDEVLLERPIGIAGAEGAPGMLRASELALPKQDGRGARRLAQATLGGTTRAVVLAVPHGEGEVIVAGALDAWRYRAEDDDGFRRFWRAAIAAAGDRAPMPLELALAPGVAAAGDTVQLEVRIRPSELTRSAGATAVAPTTASIVDERGAIVPLRLWPGAVPGRLAATFTAPPAGRYDIRVSSGERRADAVLLVAGTPRQDPDAAGAELVAAATGGVVAAAADPAAVLTHFDTLEAPRVVMETHPTQSPWWAAVVALALCVEWTLRRRGGAR